MQYPRVKYQFINNVNGETYDLKDDPKGWETSERNIKRSTKNFAMYREYSKNLQFVGEAARKLTEYFAAYDVEADITLKEFRIIPNTTTEQYYTHTTGELDFIDYDKEDNYVKIPFNSGGLRKLIDAQLSEKFNVKRLTSILDTEIPELNLKDVLLTSREILLISILENDSEEIITAPTSNFGQIFLPNLNVVSNSDANNIGIVASSELFTFSSTNVFSNQFFYYNSDVSKTITVSNSWHIRGRKPGLSTTRFNISVLKYNLSSSGFNYVQQYFFLDTDFGATTNQGENERVITLEQGDCLMYTITVSAGGGTGNNNPVYLEFLSPLDLRITENSQTPETNTKAVLFHDLMDRLCEIITGEQGLFYSETFGRTELGYAQNGKYALEGVTLGFWVRNFLEKFLETSVKEATESANAIYNTSYSFYKINGKERMVVEELPFFFQEDTVFDLGDISTLKEYPAKEFYYSGVEFGYKKPTGDRLYEEAMGLDEFNIKNSYTLPITRKDDTYSKLSDYRDDGYGKAFAARRPKLNYPEQDTRYDQDKFWLHLKEGQGLAYLEKLWQDYYETQPTGVYSPDTATGLGFTPFRNMERHEWFFAAGLRKDIFQSKYINFANSSGNSGLTTKKAGEPARTENSKKQLSETIRSRIVPYWYELEKKIDFAFSQLLEGFTEVNGRPIPNLFFKVKFRYQGQVHYGYIFEVKPDGVGKWKLLKAL